MKFNVLKLLLPLLGCLNALCWSENQSIDIGYRISNYCVFISRMLNTFIAPTKLPVIFMDLPTMIGLKNGVMIISISNIAVSSCYLLLLLETT